MRRMTEALAPDAAHNAKPDPRPWNQMTGSSLSSCHTELANLWIAWPGDNHGLSGENT
ncbi:hypothetical protein [Methylobacterium nodulans]|uniref:hypothetical protein n=1 Tax=Methylobacterium nodulans TaxID=114616 RepID=UPI0012EE8966|nr:hypothetical protein [Methylobacterium nodulans]